jgi:acetoin utilization protein AcuC
MTARAAFVYGSALTTHQLPEDHPLKPRRLRWTYELLEHYDAFSDSNSVLVEPRFATKEELLSYHAEEYVEAVESFSRIERLEEQGRFHFSDYGDNPTFPGMYEASCLSTGASIVAAEMVESGEVEVAFNISGGLHHAFPNRASGFCIFNDPVIAINYLLSKGKRVAYVDVDAHHGDGVQHAFYNTSRVLTVSIHESGRYLFPGTGFVDELGEGDGQGYSANVPLYPYTGDDVYIRVFREVVIPLLKAFEPDVLFSQFGVDTYYTDPITHMQLTTESYIAMLDDFQRLGVPWIASGGGGYDPAAVARCWALSYGVMAGKQWPDDIPEPLRERLGASKLRDVVDPVSSDTLKREAELYAEEALAEVRKTIFPIHGLA